MPNLRPVLLAFAIFAGCHDDGPLAVLRGDAATPRDIAWPTDITPSPDLTLQLDLVVAPDLTGPRCSPDGGIIDFLRDPNNCGRCGIRCCVQQCLNGSCWCEAHGGLTRCPDPPGGCACHVFDLRTDNQNCGRCGLACTPPQICIAGACK